MTASALVPGVCEILHSRFSAVQLPLQPTQEKTLHMDITRWSIPKSSLCSALSFLVSSPTGLVDSEVTQTPKYLIKSRKQQVTLM